jgi:energy-coupling factor transporter ATP-binding protein EcfA2
MQVKHLSFKKLYGFMNKDISFNDRICILVGINGSGKTSVLNLLNWLLTLNIDELCLIEFESINLHFKYEDDDYELICLQNQVEILFKLENITTGKVFPQVQATFNEHPKKLTKNKLLRDSLKGKYRRLGPESHEVETWSFITNTLPSPTIIGLDRNLYAHEGDDFRFQEEFIGNERIRIREKAKDTTPIDKVKFELIKNYNIYRNNVLIFYSSINRKIILSAFDDIITDENLSKIIASPRPTIKEIEILQGQVKEFLSENQIIMSRKAQKSKDLTEIAKVDEYFLNLKNILKTTQSSSDALDLLYLINVTQFKKINELVLEFKKYEEVTIRLYKPLEEFLNTLNKFFIDSSKELYFDKKTSQIFFNILDNKGRKIDSNRDLENLSSGEKQILILLTYIKYNLNLNLFIIDEPELSLHPKWQGEFLAAVEKIMPKDAQLILATHSPEIVGDNEQYCEVLLPYN